MGILYNTKCAGFYNYNDNAAFYDTAMMSRKIAMFIISRKKTILITGAVMRNNIVYIGLID